MASSKRKQLEKQNKVKNTSTEDEAPYGLQTKDHSLQLHTLGSTEKDKTPEKRISSVSTENTQCKRVKISDEIKQKSVCTTSEKEESLLGKIKVLTDERMDILNDFFNQKLESLNRRVEQVQCNKSQEERAKTLLRKVSKLEGRINAVIALWEEVFSEMAVRQTFKQFPYLPPLPRPPLCPEFTEESQDTPQNPETASALCAKPKRDHTSSN